jgi:hypothetical protein
VANPLERELNLDVGPALASLRELDDRLNEIVAAFQTSLTGAVAEAVGTVTVTDADASVVTDAVAAAIDEGAATTATVADADAAAVETAVVEAVEAGAAEPAVIDADATAVTETIGTAVADADTTATIVADTGQIPPDIEAAIAAADASVLATVDADTGPAQAAIDSLEAAPVEIVVEADTADAQAQIDTLGETAADSSSQVGDLAANTELLAALAGAAAGELGGLEGAVSGLGASAAATVGGLAALGGFVVASASNAIDAETAQARFNRELGATAAAVDTIDLGGLNTDISELALSLGSSDDALRAAAANIAQLGRSAGASQEEIAAATEQILVLATRAVALNPALGDAGTVAENLTRALASGRDRALVPYGIALDRTAVAADASRRALAAGRSEVGLWDRIAAGAAVTTEQLGDSLAVDVASGAELSEVRLRSLRTQLGETLEALGAPLVSPLLDIVESAVPAAEALARILTQLSEAALPLLPPILDVVTAALEVLASVIEAIPEPVLSAVTTFILFNRTVGLVNSALAAVGSSVTLSLGPIGLLAAGVAAAATALGLLGSSGRDAAAEADAAGNALFGAARTADDLAATLTTLNDRFDAYVANVADFGEETGLIAEAQRQLGLTNRDLQAALTGTNAQFDAYARAVASTVEPTQGLLDISGEIVEELEQERENLQAASRAQLELLRSTEDITQAQFDAAVAANTAQDGTVNYFQALEDATRAAADNERAQQRITAANLDAAGVWDQLRAAVISGAAGLEDAGRIAGELGVDIADVEDRIRGFQAELDTFVTAATGALPTVGDAFDAWQRQASDAVTQAQVDLDAGSIGMEEAFLRVVAAADPARLVEQLAAQTAAVTDFQQNLQELLARGLTDTVAFLVEQGPQLGATLAEQLVDEPATAAQLESVIDAYDTAFGDYETFIRTQGAPRVLTATDEAARGAAGAWGTGFDLVSATETAFAEAVAVIQRANPTVSTEAAAAAVASDRAFADRFNPDRTASARMTAAGNLLGRADVRGRVTGPAGSVGAGARDEFGRLFDPAAKVPDAFRAAAIEMRNTALVLYTEAGPIGVATGERLGLGIAAGIRSTIDDVAAAAAEAVRAAEAAARRAARASSPSQLFAAIGADLTEGLAIGIENNLERLARANAALIDAATPRITLDPAIANTTVTGAGRTELLVFDLDINLTGTATDADARRVAQTTVAEIERFLARRNVIAAVRAEARL